MDITFCDYRIVKDKNGFSFREVFYNKKGKPHSWTAEPCSPYGETEEEFSQDLAYMAEALKLPFLEEKGDKLVVYNKSADITTC